MTGTDEYIHFGNPGYEETDVFYLDHSCDEWVIGDLQDAKAFIARLQQLVDEKEKTE